MKAFRDTKRRATQQMLQTLGVVKGAEDSEFAASLAEYRATVDAVKSLQKSMRRHLDAIRLQQSTAASLTMELAAFHHGTEAAEAAKELGQANAELERVQLAAVERLYEEMVIATADVHLWQAPEIEDRVKQRKKKLLDYHAHLRKFEAAKSQLANSQNQPVNSNAKSGNRLRRRKTEQEMSEEVETRKVKVEQAEEAVTEITQWLMQQFDELAEKRMQGEILEDPMAALAACQQHLARSQTQRLSQLEEYFPKLGIHEKRLETYDSELAKMSPLDVDGLVHMTNQTRPTRGGKVVGTCFGQPLTKGAPNVVCECMSYIEANGMDVEGIFRVPGAMEVVTSLRQSYDSGEVRCVEQSDNCEPHDVSTLMKQFFRELPTPLISTDIYPELLAAVREDLNLKDENTAKQVCAAAQKLPQENLQCLGLLLHFLKNVASHSDTNKMTSANLATCFAPSLMRAPEDTPPHVVLNDMQVAIAAVRVLIDHADKFPNPKRTTGAARPSMHTSKPSRELSEVREKIPNNDDSSSPSNAISPPPGMETTDLS